MVRVGINGFGRIGRLAFRLAFLKHESELVISAINTSGSMPVFGWAHLVTYDTMYRKFEREVTSQEVKDPKDVSDADPLIGYINTGGKEVPILAQRDPEKIPWGKYKIDVVIESTGKFVNEEGGFETCKSGSKAGGYFCPFKGWEC